MGEALKRSVAETGDGLRNIEEKEKNDRGWL